MRAFIVTLALAGMIVSSLALRAHYAEDVTSTLSSSHWDSSFVNHSSYSAVAGIPVAALGIVGYAAVYPGLLPSPHTHVGIFAFWARLRSLFDRRRDSPVEHVVHLLRLLSGICYAHHYAGLWPTYFWRELIVTHQNRQELFREGLVEG